MKEIQIKRKHRQYLYGKMSELITGLSHFDEKLKLKLQLNLELTEQDDKVWDKHLEILTSLNKQHLSPGEMNGDDRSLEEIIENVQELIYQSMQSDDQNNKKNSKKSKSIISIQYDDKEDELEMIREKQSQQIENMKKIQDSLRTVMQKQSITWKMLQQSGMNNAKDG